MVNWTVTWGLLIAWVLHDLEELFTLPAWSGRMTAAMRRRYPRLPDWIWRLFDPSRARIAIAITLMGLIFVIASTVGAASAGTSPLFQVVLIGFGVHGLFHVGWSVALRGYTPGVVTAVLVVLPFSIWAWREVAHAGIVSDVGWWLLPITLALLQPVLFAVHALGYVVLTFARRLRRAAAD
jgi:hypothetical protein